MSFDALTITGLLTAAFSGGFLIALSHRDDGAWTRPRRRDRTDQSAAPAPRR